MTGYSDIIKSAKVIIHDDRWDRDLAANPAKFYRGKSDYVEMALPRLNRPPDLFDYLTKNHVKPSYAGTTWISTEDSLGEETAVQTGQTGFSLCSVSLITQNGLMETAYAGTVYDAETGIVTFPVQTAVGLKYSIDFYTDGSFQTLTDSMTRLFSLAVAVVWDEGFERDWLNIQPKIKDSSFDVGNEANFINQSKGRKLANQRAFEDELEKYGQNCAYREVLSGRSRTVLY